MEGTPWRGVGEASGMRRWGPDDRGGKQGGAATAGWVQQREPVGPAGLQGTLRRLEAGPLLGVPLEAGVERRSWTAGAEAHRMDRGGGGAKPPQTAPTTF